MDQRSSLSIPSRLRTEVVVHVGNGLFDELECSSASRFSHQERDRGQEVIYECSGDLMISSYLEPGGSLLQCSTDLVEARSPYIIAEAAHSPQDFAQPRLRPVSLTRQSQSMQPMTTLKRYSEGCAQIVSGHWAAMCSQSFPDGGSSGVRNERATSAQPRERKRNYCT